MKYANLGNTGVRVSRICLGMMSYGSPEWRDWVLGYEDARVLFPLPSSRWPASPPGPTWGCSTSPER